MENETYAVVDTATGKVVNIVAWDGVQEYSLAAGLEKVLLPQVEQADPVSGEITFRYTGGIGWSYVDGVFVDERPVDEDEV